MITFEHFKMARAHKWLARILAEVSEGHFIESDKFTCREDVAWAFHEQVSEELEFAPPNKNPSGFAPHPWGACAETCHIWLNAPDEVLWQIYQACQEEGERVMENILLDVSSGSDPDWEWVQKCLEQVFQQKLSNYKLNQVAYL